MIEVINFIKFGAVAFLVDCQISTVLPIQILTPRHVLFFSLKHSAGHPAQVRRDPPVDRGRPALLRVAVHPGLPDRGDLHHGDAGGEPLARVPDGTTRGWVRRLRPARPVEPRGVRVRETKEANLFEETKSKIFGCFSKMMGSDALFVTILRNPVEQFESRFKYYNFQDVLHVDIHEYLRG